jgi:glycosyltransferase involved in cell wall biosynthesis
MRLLFLNHNVAWSGGTFFRAYQFGRQMVRRGHQVTLFAISAERRTGFNLEMRDGVEIVHTPDLMRGRARTGWDPWDTLNRIDRLRSTAWDVIHSWDTRPAVILPALYARRRSVAGALVIDWCDWWGRGGTQSERPGRFGKLLYAPVETFFEEAFRHRADATTAISQLLADRAARLGVPSPTIHVLPQGCDTDTPVAGDRQAARRELGIPINVPLIVSVGVLTASEAALLFASLRRLFHERPDIQFLMIGRHGAAVPADLAARQNFAETGFIPEDTLRAHVAASDALLVPLAPTLASRARWPSKVNPFLAAGRTVIITRVGDLAALLEREDAAVIADPTAESIASKTAAFLETTAMRSKYEHRGRAVATEKLGWSVLSERLETVYRSCRQ